MCCDFEMPVLLSVWGFFPKNVDHLPVSVCYDTALSS